MAKQKTCQIHSGYDSSRDCTTRCGQPAKFVIRNYFRRAGPAGDRAYYACESCSRINPFHVWEKLDRRGLPTGKFQIHPVKQAIIELNKTEKNIADRHCGE